MSPALCEGAGMHAAQQAQLRFYWARRQAGLSVNRGLACLQHCDIKWDRCMSASP